MSILEVRRLKALSGSSLNVGGAGVNVSAETGVTLQCDRMMSFSSDTTVKTDGEGNIIDTAPGLDAHRILLSTNTISNGSAIIINEGITSSHNEYIFKFVDISVSNDGAFFQFQVSHETDTIAANFGETQTSVTFSGLNYGSSSGTSLSQTIAYNSYDEYISDDPQYLSRALSNASVSALSGNLHLMRPASVAFSKNWFARTSHQTDDSTYTNSDMNTGGNFKDTDQIKAIIFNVTSGTFSGTIKMYGVS